MTDLVELLDVSPRDGLQNLPVVPTAVKVALVERLVAAGCRRVELTSFVNPARVPQLADAAELAAATAHLPAAMTALIVNERGLERARDAGVGHVNFVILATESFNVRNQGEPVAASLERWGRIAEAAGALGIGASVTVGAAFGCPYEGEVALADVVALVERLGAHAPESVTLADTIGVAVPSDVSARITACREVTAAPIRCHFHNTRNTAAANVVAALDAGVTSFDTALGGFGGCPFAPRATGNLATEDAVYLLHRMGVPTGLDLDALVDTAGWLAAELDQPLAGLVARAGPFPRPAEVAS